MRLMPFSLVLLACTSLTAFAAPASECSALQAEVEALRAKVRALEASALPVTTPPQQAAAALPGTAAKPAAVARVVIEEPYSRTGCSRGLFKGIAPARWQDIELWRDLAQGQSPAEVEQLLGIEHYDERGGRNVIWHYGNCGASSRAQVLFTDGKVADWQAPAN